jgi:hypothetical protein
VSGVILILLSGPSVREVLFMSSMDTDRPFRQAAKKTFDAGTRHRPNHSSVRHADINGDLVARPNAKTLQQAPLERHLILGRHSQSRARVQTTPLQAARYGLAA